MTNEEIKQSLEAMKAAIAAIEKQLAGSTAIIIDPPPLPPNPVKDVISDGPDEDGRVRFTECDKWFGSQGLPETWFLSAITVKLLGREALDDKQFETIRTNVGCTEDGTLTPIGPMVYSGAGRENKNTGFCRPLEWKKPPFQFWKPEQWYPADHYFNDGKRTIGTRCETVADILTEYKRMTT